MKSNHNDGGTENTFEMLCGPGDNETNFLGLESSIQWLIDSSPKGNRH